MPFIVSLFVLMNAALCTAHTQTYPVDQGSLLIGGRASFTSVAIDNGEASDSDRTNQFVFNPTGQYFITPGLTVGGDVLLGYASREGSTTARYGVGPTVTYFFGRGERRYYPFLSSSFGVTHARNDDLEEGRTQTSYRGAGGILVMLSRNVGVTGELFYQRTDDDQLQTNTFGLAFGVSAFLY